MKVELSFNELEYLIHLMYLDRKICLVDEDMCDYSMLQSKLQVAYGVNIP